MAEVTAVTVSMRVMSASDEYKYLLRMVAAGGGQRLRSLTGYYAEVGTPPGRWMGGGPRGIGGGLVAEGDVVTEAQLQLPLLIGLGRDPVTDESLGRAYLAYRTAADRALDGPQADGGGLTERAAASALEQPNENCRRAVAGYDFTFSIPKSASIL